MARKIPLAENPTIHPILSLSLLITCIAATIAVVSTMCGLFSRKKSSSQEKNSEEIVSQPNEATKTPDNPIATSPTKEGDDLELDTSNNMPQEIEKPLPPASSYDPHSSRASSFHFRSNSNVSFGKLTSTMSMKVQGGIKAIRQSSRRELDSVTKNGKNLKHEDSLWKKQIILGERCRVPNENEEDDTIIYDENGHKISAYHRKPPGSLAVSRQSSEIDTNAIPS